MVVNSLNHAKLDTNIQCRNLANLNYSNKDLPVLTYIRISIVNIILTLGRLIIASICTTYHNLFSLNKRNGKWIQTDTGSVYELHPYKSQNSRLVSLLDLNKPTSSTSIEDLAKDVNSMVRAHLKLKKQNIKSVNIVLVGNSMGAATSLMVAALLKTTNNVRVVSIHGPQGGSKLLKMFSYNPKSMLHQNFHPYSPSVTKPYRSDIPCERIIAGNDHIVPKTNEELNYYKQEGCIINPNGHTIFGLSKETTKLIMGKILQSNFDDVNKKTYIYVMYGLYSAPGAVYPLAQKINTG